MRINIDVLNAQDQLFSARRDLAKARYDTLINSLKLKASTASLTDSDVLSLNMLLSPTDDTALTALPVAPSVPHPGAAARKNQRGWPPFNAAIKNRGLFLMRRRKSPRFFNSP